MKNGISIFACSETQKFGHVTFFWNGNRSGYFDSKLETYLEVGAARQQLFSSSVRIYRAVIVMTYLSNGSRAGPLQLPVHKSGSMRLRYESGNTCVSSALSPPSCPHKNLWFGRHVCMVYKVVAQD